MNEKTNLWVRGLVSAAITGASTAFLTALGITGADAVGLNVGSLNWKQIGFITLAGGVVGLAAYLKQSPIPPE